MGKVRKKDAQRMKIFAISIVTMLLSACGIATIKEQKIRDVPYSIVRKDVSHFFKRYSDPNSLYYSACRKEKYSPEEWHQGDLSNTSGYMQSANKTFLTCMEQITGEPYRY